MLSTLAPGGVVDRPRSPNPDRFQRGQYPVIRDRVVNPAELQPIPAVESRPPGVQLNFTFHDQRAGIADRYQGGHLAIMYPKANPEGSQEPGVGVALRPTYRAELDPWYTGAVWSG